MERETKRWKLYYEYVKKEVYTHIEQRILREANARILER